MDFPIRVLMVTRERSGDRRYGLGKSLGPIVEALTTEGMVVSYLTQEDAGARSWAAVSSLHRLLTRLLSPLFRGSEVPALVWGVLERFNMGRLAAKVAYRDGYTHVHCHDPLIAWGFCWAMRFGMGRPKLHWGITQHGFGAYVQAMHEDGARFGHHAMRLFRALESRILRAADWVVYPTKLSRSQTQRDLAWPLVLPSSKVIPHPRPDLNLPERGDARRRLGLSVNAWIWLAVGRLVPLKAFDLLLEAFALLPSSVQQPLHLCIAGGGDAAPLWAHAQRLGIADRLFIAETDAINDFYAAADAYISTSRSESFGMANLEAMCAGLPVLATSVGGVPEVLGGAALWLPVDEPVVWARQMLRCQKEPALRGMLSREAHERAKVWPDAKRVAKAYCDLYRGRFSEISLSFSRDLFEWQEKSFQRAAHAIPEPLRFEGLRRVLVLAPHADDETFGCGGALILFAKAGIDVQVCVMTDGAGGDPEKHCAGDTVSVRMEEARAALECLGVSDPLFLGLPDGRLADVDRLVEKLRGVIEESLPDWVFFPNPEDAHVDHVTASHAAIACCMAMENPPKLFAYEVWQPMKVNRLLDITDVFGKKAEALSCYRLPCSYVDYLEAAKGLAAYRAIQLPQGRGFAEGFLEFDLVGKI